MSGGLRGAAVAGQWGPGGADRGHLQGAEVRKDQQARHLHQVSSVRPGFVMMHECSGWLHSRVGSSNMQVKVAKLNLSK